MQGRWALKTFLPLHFQDLSGCAAILCIHCQNWQASRKQVSLDWFDMATLTGLDDLCPVCICSACVVNLWERICTGGQA